MLFNNLNKGKYLFYVHYSRCYINQCSLLTCTINVQRDHMYRTRTLHVQYNSDMPPRKLRKRAKPVVEEIGHVEEASVEDAQDDVEGYSEGHSGLNPENDIHFIKQQQQMKSLFPKGGRSTFNHSEKN